MDMMDITKPNKSHLQFEDEEVQQQKRFHGSVETLAPQLQGNARVEDIITTICENFDFSSLAYNLERLQNSKDRLHQMLQIYALDIAMGVKGLSRIRLPHVSFSIGASTLSDTSSFKTIDDDDDLEKVVDEEGAEEFLYDIETCGPLDDDSWAGLFKGFQTVSEEEELIINEGKQCIELEYGETEFKLMGLLRGGINCFMIDFFKSTNIDHQKIILKLHECEFKVSYEMGYPIMSTLFALLTPRLQYTGMLKKDLKTTTVMLNQNDKVVLTTKRMYSHCCTAEVIYVNGRFLINDCKIGDFILIGPSIQVVINKIRDDNLYCIVKESGTLLSRLPVRFPSRCERFSVSFEEMEDITFAREVGINTIISYAPGSQKYFEELNICLQLLKCETMRFGTRIVLNDPKSFDENDLPWIAQKYDAFLLDFNWWQGEECHDKGPPEIEPDVLKLTPAAVQFIKTIYELKKPIILNAKLFADRVLFVHPENIPEIFYYPDRYLFSHEYLDNAFYFNFLQRAIFEQLIKFELEPLPYCDKSHVGSDSLARSCVTACYENVNIKAIVVCSLIADMSIKLSHFRPNIPIICVTSIKSISYRVGMYHNITYLYYNKDLDIDSVPTHEKNVFRSFLFGILHLKLRNFLVNEQHVMLIYGTSPGTKYPDKYVVYKFQSDALASTLKQSLFT